MTDEHDHAKPDQNKSADDKSSDDTQTPDSTARPTAAFALSLVAGFWMIAAGGMMTMGFAWDGGMMGGVTPWMWQHGLMEWMRVDAMWSVLGLLAGIVTIFSAVALFNTPGKASLWGTVILVAAGVDLFAGMGGFLAGVLGVVGGIMALMWKA